MGDTASANSMRATVNVAICGNPNCGKTTIFNAITGLRQRVANFPGVTVEKTIGQFEIRHRHRPGHHGKHRSAVYNLIDIPGAYSLSAFSPDEYIAAQALFGEFGPDTAPDVIICVIDATNLDRGLYLLFQVVQIGKPTLVALNMMDLAARRGLRIDVAELSRQLGGLTVIPLVGSKGTGLTELKEAVAEAADSEESHDFDIYHPATLSVIRRLEAAGGDGVFRTRAEYLRVLFDVGGPAERAFLNNADATTRNILNAGRDELTEQFGSLTAAETSALTQTAGAIAAAVIAQADAGRKTTTERIDRYMLHPVLGPIIMVAVMAFVFQSIFSWAAPVMAVIDHLFSHLAALVGGVLPEGPFRSLMVDGVIDGVGSVLVFLPQIVILFLFIAFLEDSGYMPRLAFLVDRAFRWCGLSGKSFIPLLSSYACAVPGIMATRTIEDRKLRYITILVAPLMTCSARLPVYAIMIAAFIPYHTVLGLFNSHGMVLGMLYLLGLVVAILVSLVLNTTFLKTQRGTFMMELPSYKLPTLSSVIIRVYSRAKSFVLRAGTVILAITVIVWALSYYPRSEPVLHEYDNRLALVDTDYSARRTALDAASGSDFTEQVERLELSHREARMQIINERAGAQLRNSYLGRIGRAVEPAFVPLGWDWRVTVATLASFPAREVIIATLGTIFNLGSEGEGKAGSLAEQMHQARWESGDKVGTPVFSPAVALSIMVFFALCCQCGATVVTIRQETRSWKFAAGTFAYMTILAYLGAMIVYQVFSRVWS